MRFHISEALEQAQDKGMDREEVAQMLERYADAARNGYTQLPEDRGEWWLQTHESETGRRESGD
jgi:hypothetical protein